MSPEAMQSSDRAGARGRPAARDAHLRDLMDAMLYRACGAVPAHDPEGPTDGELRVLLRRVCDTARAHGLRAEHLVLLLKERWRELPEARRIPRQDAGDVLARVITACIREYYAEADGRR